MSRLSDYIVFNDKKLENKWGNGPVPIATLYEAYFDGDIDIPGDISEFLRNRNLFVKYSLTWDHLRWAASNFIWEAGIHTKKQDERIVREHYDRGNDFFEWFLGERMVYTSGFFQNPDETLEEAQDNKMNLACQKLKLQPGEKLLDIGCGWGTLARHAAKHYGVDATGVTISKEQTEFANQRIRDWGLEDQARVLCRDYRDAPRSGFDKIVSLEMVEHVGLKNLTKFYEQCYEMLADDGIFLLQWTGLRGMRGEDLMWGLFMNKYIFPGADASLACSPMLKAMEKAGFEFHSVENVSIHYSWTIQKWLENWLSNKDNVVAAYGERWFRIWRFFLAWSVIIGEQGNATCFQVVASKNLDAVDRNHWILDKAATLGNRLQNIAAPKKPGKNATVPAIMTPKNGAKKSHQPRG